MGRHVQLRSTRQVRRVVAAGCLAGVAAGGALVATAVSATAASLPLGTYTAALPLSPYPTVSSSTDPSGIGFPTTFTNTSSGDGYLLDHVQVNLPAGFSPQGTPTVDVAGWTASVSGNTVSADAGDPVLNGVPAGGSVHLSFAAAAPVVLAPTTFTFGTSANGILGTNQIVGDFTNTGGDPQVAVAQYANVVTCSPSQQCDTGTVGSASNTTARIVTTTGSIQDFLGISVDTPTDATCAAISQANARSQQVTFGDIDTSRTLTVTLTVDKSVVNLVPNNGVGNYDVCYNTGDPTKVFVDHNGRTTSAGWLPGCGATGLIARQPCVRSVTKTNAGDIVVTYTAPGGDPANIAGYPLPGT